MLEQVKEAIELMKQTRSVVYTTGDDLEKALKKDGILCAISKNGENRVFFNATEAKEWKIKTGGTLCNIYHMLGRLGENEVLNLVTSCKDMKADLKTWLNIRGVKVKELGDVLGIKYPTLLNWVNRKSLPDIMSGQKIAKELSLDVSQIEW